MRFQGGTLFPAVVLACGGARPAHHRLRPPEPSRPGLVRRRQVGDHWHAAYGFYVCDGWLPKLDRQPGGDPPRRQHRLGDLRQRRLRRDRHPQPRRRRHPLAPVQHEVRGQAGPTRRVPRRLRHRAEHRSSRSSPTSQGGDVYDVDDYQCNGEDVEIKVVAWDSYTDTGEGTTNIADLADVRITNDGMVFAIAVVPVGTEVEHAAVGRRAARAAVPPTVATCRPRRSPPGDTIAATDTTDAATDTTTADHRHATATTGRMMRAVVLVGGFGTRLRPLTYSRAQADAPGRPRRDDRAAHRQPGAGRRHRRHAGARVQARAVPRGVPRRHLRRRHAALRGRARAARHRRRDPVRRRCDGDRRHLRRRQRRRPHRPRRRRTRPVPP